jgi:hypothetical protein
MSHHLRVALDRVARRYRERRLWTLLSIGWLGLALVALGWWLLLARARIGAGEPARVLAAFGAMALAVLALAGWISWRAARDRRWVARRVEARYPELDAGLLAAVEEMESTPAHEPFGYLQAAVIRGAVSHSQTHDWGRTVPAWSLRASQLAQVAAFSLLTLAMLGLADRLHRTPAPGASGDLATDADFDLAIEPGDAEIERGSPLLVVARFGRDVPADAELVVEGDESGARRSMTRSLQDPTFAGRLDSVSNDLAYRVEFAGRSSPTYRVKVFDFPQVLRADADLAFPDYTGLGPKTVEDIRHVTAVEGTELTLTLRLNKPVAEARLVDKDDRAVELTPVEGSPDVYRARLTMTDPRRFQARLVDADGRQNKYPTEIAVQVTRNRPATVKVTRPSHDVRVSPIEELVLAAQMQDDFGVTRHGLTYNVAGQEPRDIALEGSGKKIDASHLLAFESLGVAPDELVTYHFWAEDVGPDGQPRRSFGDMFFAEVRPFEEIFRQGEQPPEGSAQQEQQQQGQQGAGPQAMQLAEQQKQIINATWSLIRRETGKTTSDQFVEDTTAVRDAQQAAIEKAAQVAEQLQDRASIAHMEDATGHMDSAATKLSGAVDGPTAQPLPAALAAEQAAYQALLKLRDREFQVVRGNRQQRGANGGQQAGSPSQRQLNQLELSNDQNRYEEQRSAPSQSQQGNPEDRETRQVLNRLAELARRQADLNERLKELQAALEAAEDEQAREEIERQLKRLRDQEQEILRDTDELQERMENEANRERMADAREQVEEGREHVRQASEALEQGRVSQALTEGTRASRQLDELREEIRRESSERFSEELTSMRDRARELAETQRDLTERLKGEDDRNAHSLREDQGRQRAEQALEEQGRKLDDLLDRMRSTVEEAQETEPRLANALFDAVRQADEQRVAEALDAAERLAQLGVAEEAARASEQAATGLDTLREGVERAAESVLGDETEALRLARNELDDLSRELDRELPEGERRAPDGEANPDGRPSERGDRQPPPGGGRPRDGQAGEEEGQAAPGDGQPGQRGEGQQAEPGEDPQGQGGQPREDRQGQRQAGQGRSGQGRQGQRPEGEPRPGEGQPGERQAGQAPEGNPRPDEGQPGQEGQQQPGREGQQQPGEGQQPGQGGQQPGQGGQPPGEGGQRPGGPLRGQPQDGQQPQRGGGNRDGAGDLDQLLRGLNQQGGPGGPGGPITGENFREWSDRMRDVEELLDDPELRAEAARIRDRVRVAREDFKRHSKEPDPTQLQSLVAEPLRELRDRVAEEVRRRESPDSLVPIDRDPVPPQYADRVRRYYERLGSGE